ncbi:MAG TPA: hypothetical protein VNQ80_02385 [Parapedobacter sp.]|uniref:hypothetical protein n=1 Tax=Parapedobacter sp. TaxID=1958893 RepID=UPI002CB91A7C|nr:hypothetical protein [Parapedobacter sp.]HWK56156.1 hypothetical protein [Parapedobacter sp.]
MEKEEKFEPKDSTRDVKQQERAVTRKASQGHVQKGEKMANPALKRKFSEQPPTKHNSKT